jgi:hypothetical protein
MNRLWLGWALAAGLAVVGSAGAAPHPVHDDGGAVNWRPDLAAALRLAQTSGKPVFIEAGSET